MYHKPWCLLTVFNRGSAALNPEETKQLLYLESSVVVPHVARTPAWFTMKLVQNTFDTGGRCGSVQICALPERKYRICSTFMYNNNYRSEMKPSFFFKLFKINFLPTSLSILCYNNITSNGINVQRRVQ